MTASTRLVAVTAFVVAVAAFAPAPAAAQRPPVAVGPPVALEGELDVLYEDDDNGGRLLYFLNTSNGRVPLRFQGEAPDLPTGSRVRVTGNLADGTVTTASVTTIAVSPSRTLGTEDALVILFNFSNNATQPYTPASTASVNDQVASFYQENSYGQTFITFNVVGWFTIAATNSTCDYYTWASQADAAATSAGVNLAAYDRFIYAFPRASACSWTGMGNVAGPRSWINGGYALRTVAHEQGHNFGNHHSHAMRCDSTGCTSVDYGDDRDVLGASGVVGHMNAYQKERLGWLNYGSSPVIQTVSTGSEYWIDPYETAGTSPKALKVWNPTNSTYYYIESRARTGFDGSITPGVTVHSGSPTNGTTSYQIDLAPSTTTWDSTLDVGQVFRDDVIGLNVQTVSTSASGAVVSVIFGTLPCTAAAPTVSLASSSFLRYTVTVANNDGMGCTASPFTFSSSVPAGWSGAFSPTTLASLAPGSSASATLTLTAPTGTSGSYSFSVNATNSNSGYSASATASLMLAASLDVTTSAALTANGNNRAAAIGASVTISQAPVAGAAVTVVVTKPSGATSTLSTTTAADGTASVRFSLKPKDPSGTYQVRTSASSNGGTGSSTTSFVVP